MLYSMICQLYVRLYWVHVVCQQILGLVSLIHHCLCDIRTGINPRHNLYHISIGCELSQLTILKL